MRRICVVTGSRAEYGLLHWLMRDIDADPECDLQVVASGMHLSPAFGLTYREIEEDGFTIDAKVETLLSSDTPVGIAKSLGLGVVGFADALDRLAPEILVLLGDRFEVFAAAQAALLARIPIAHIHGGESSEGAVDEAMRHAITKMAHLHYVAAESYRQRVIQLGEDPERVFNVGAPGLDSVARIPLLDRAEVEAVIGLPLRARLLLVTYHPATLGARPPGEATDALLAALDRFPDASVVFTRPNADAEGQEIRRRIDAFAADRADRVAVFTSLGQCRYLSVMAQCDAVVGNSSSGLIEAPAIGKPTVNIGDRQRGRLKARSVIDCAEEADEIAAAIRQALLPEFIGGLREIENPYGRPGASRRIMESLKAVTLEGILAKRFYDLQTDTSR